MLIRSLNRCEKFVAGDETVLRELLHPAKADLKLRYSLAHAVVKPGQTSQPHKMKTSEVYYILEGKGLMHIGDDTSPVAAGDAVYIPPDAIQFINNTGKSDLKFLCIVDPAWRPEDEVII